MMRCDDNNNLRKKNQKKNRSVSSAVRAADAVMDIFLLVFFITELKVSLTDVRVNHITFM